MPVKTTLATSSKTHFKAKQKMLEEIGLGQARK